MNADSVRRLVAAHGPPRGTIFCEDATREVQPVRNQFCMAGGQALAEALLGAAGLLDGFGYWTLRPISAGNTAESAPAVAVHEATSTSVRLTLRPGLGHTTLNCHLLVFRDKGEDPRAVRKRLKDAVETLRAASPPPVPPTPPTPPTPPPVEPGAVVIDRPARKELAPAAPRRTEQAADRAYLRQVIDAVDAARSATELGAFVRAVGLEFGPGMNEQGWADRLARLARTGVLAERRNGRRVTGYTATEWGRQQALDPETASAGRSSAGSQ